MCKILIADDAKFMREIIKNIVIDMGHEVCAEAENGEIAIDKATELHPDIITMDITMPVVNGLEAVKAIRDRGITSNIIVCTALNQSDLILEALKNGADDYIVKPIYEDRFKDVLYKYMK